MINYTEVFQTGTLTLNVKMMLLAISFLGGIIASISPCSLAMLPIIIGYIGGYSNSSTAKILGQVFFFILGNSILFAIIGVICALTGQVFTSVLGEYFLLFLSSIIMIMGLKLLGFLDFDFPIFIKEIPQKQGSSIILYPMLIGAVFALAGTPCSTPILAGIMSFAALSKNVAISVIMLFLFALGQSFILFIAALFTSSVKNLKSLSGISSAIMKTSGILLVATSVYIFYKIFSPLL